MAVESWYVHEGEGDVKKSVFTCYFCSQNTILEIRTGEILMSWYHYVCDNAECRAKGEPCRYPEYAWKNFTEDGEVLQPSIYWWDTPGKNSLRRKTMEEHGFTSHRELNQMLMDKELERIFDEREKRRKKAKEKD